MVERRLALAYEGRARLTIGAAPPAVHSHVPSDIDINSAPAVANLPVPSDTSTAPATRAVVTIPAGPAPTVIT
jgi:hypothetical protein